MRCRLRMFRIGLQIGSVVVADWRDDAVCATTDPDLFFPESRDVRAERQAKKICAGCPVVQDCLEFLLSIQSSFMTFQLSKLSFGIEKILQRLM